MHRALAGIIGIVIAIAALTATVLAEHVLPNPAMKSQSNLSVRFGRLNLGWASKVPEPPAAEVEQRTVHERVRLTGIVCALIALPLAIVSWASRERVWWGMGIVIFATAALAWQWFVAAFFLLALSGALFAFVPAESRSATV